MLVSLCPLDLNIVEPLSIVSHTGEPLSIVPQHWRASVHWNSTLISLCPLFLNTSDPLSIVTQYWWASVRCTSTLVSFFSLHLSTDWAIISGEPLSILSLYWWASVYSSQHLWDSVHLTSIVASICPLYLDTNAPGDSLSTVPKHRQAFVYFKPLSTVPQRFGKVKR